MTAEPLTTEQAREIAGRWAQGRALTLTERERWSDIDPIARAGSDINTLALVVCEGLDLDLETARVLTRAAGCWS